MKKDKNFRSTNLNLVTFLFVNNQQINGINPINEEKKEFSLARTDQLEELVWLYKFGDRDDERLLVPVYRYEQARRELLEKLNY